MDLDFPGAPTRSKPQLRLVEQAVDNIIPARNAIVCVLARVVRCFAIDLIRRRRTRGTFASSDLGESAVDPAADPERSLIGSQRLKRVMASIEAMPPRRREVFLLHRVEELTYAQIARRLNVTIKAVEKHMHLAMRQLSDTDD